MTDEAMSPLRRRMIEDMMIRKIASASPARLARSASRTLGHETDAIGDAVS